MMKIFTMTCPSCHAKDKIMERCNECGIYCCRDCSIDNICLDCYILKNRSKELRHYYEDKYAVET